MEPTNPTIFFLFTFFSLFLHIISISSWVFVLLVFSFSPGLFFVYTHKQTEWGSRVPFSLSLYVHLRTHADTRIKGEAGTARIGRCMENRREREDGYNKLKVAPAFVLLSTIQLAFMCVCVYVLYRNFYPIARHHNT